MPAWLKDTLMTAAVVLVVMAIVSRVKMIRDIVAPAA